MISIGAGDRRRHGLRTCPLRRLSILGLALSLVLAAAAVTLLSTTSAGAADAPAAPVQITEAPPLEWGFKESWRTYVGSEGPHSGTTASEGAEKFVPAGKALYNLHWAFGSGSYDAETGVTQLDYEGTVHWVAHPASEIGGTPPAGYQGEPNPYILDVTMSDPEITISRDSSVISVEMKSRSLTTWEMIDYGRVPLVNLEAVGVTPTVDGGTTTWAGIPAALSEEGVDAFAGFYRIGQVLEPLSFSYEGPGGAPDFSEHFDEEGAPSLRLVETKSIGASGSTNLWTDPERLLSHEYHEVTQDGTRYYQLETFDFGKMAEAGRPQLLPVANVPKEATILAVDGNEQRLLYHLAGETGITRELRWDPTAERYEEGTLTDPQLTEAAFIGSGTVAKMSLAWDRELDLGYRVQRVVPEGVGATEYDAQEWQLITYEEGADHTWTKESYPLPSFPQGQNATGYASGTSLAKPAYATASDGSLIILATPRTSTDADDPAPAKITGAYRVKLDQADGSASVEALPVEVDNEEEAVAGTFTWVKTAAGGQILLGNEEEEGPLVHCRIDGDAVHCDPPVSVYDNVETTFVPSLRAAVDPEDGTIWYAGRITRKLAAFRDGRFLGAQVAPRLSGTGSLRLVIGEDHAIYARTGEEDGNLGWGKFELEGFAPTVTTQPQAQAVSLGAGVASEPVTFTSAASVTSGEPDPSVQWQAKAPGASRFTDLAGATAGTLAVHAEPGMDGTEYRAVYEDAAGRVASEAARLTVEYAPRLNLDVPDVTATEGQDATFSVFAEGNPEPQITWERRVGGFWQPISGGDGNFAIGAGALTLTVKETNTEQSDAHFRAKLTNSVTEEPGQNPVYSRVATLTVNPKVSIPSGGVEVKHASLDWLGNEEMQGAPPAGGSNYFSAGVSGGDEVTYRSVEGDAAVWQVSSTGSEALATYATRADHVTDGGRQVARLYGGEGRVEPDGSATIDWHAAFSVNFYGGFVPFTITDPELKVGADGSGELTATLTGCSSSQANFSVCTPLAAPRRVTVATFEDATVEPGKELTVTPDYAGVVAPLPDPLPQGVFAQDTSVAGWGSWPASFVEFQLETGLDSYWYSSGGGADPDKPPLPFTVNLEGPEPPASEPPATENPGGDSGTGPSGGRSGDGTGTPTQPGGSKSKGKPARVTLAKTVRLDRKGAATIAGLACPRGGAACETIVPARIAARIGGRRWLLGVAAPKKIKAGRGAAVKVTLPKGARAALGDGKLTLRLRIAVRSGKKMTAKVARVTIVGRG